MRHSMRVCCVRAGRGVPTRRLSWEDSEKWNEILGTKSLAFPLSGSLVPRLDSLTPRMERSMSFAVGFFLCTDIDCALRKIWAIARLVAGAVGPMAAGLGTQPAPV